MKRDDLFTNRFVQLRAELGFNLGRKLLFDLKYESEGMSTSEPETEDDLAYMEAIRLRNLGLDWRSTPFSGRPATQVRRLFLIWERAWSAGYWDYQRLLELGAESDDLFAQSFLGVDEANDFTPIMFKIIARSSARSTVVACDPDQSLYTWSGARPEDVFTLPFDSQVLLQRTDRVPSVIAAAADTLLDRASYRAPGRMISTREGGSVEVVQSIDTAFSRIKGKSALVLGRTRRHVREMELIGVREYGLNVEKNIDLRGAVRVIEGNKRYLDKRDIADILKLDYSLFNPDMRKRLRQMNAVSRAELTREFALDDLAEALRCHYPIFLEGEIIHHEYNPALPKVEFMTKHAAKGLEADHVVNLLNITTAIERGAHPDDELRLEYVAMTRARQSVMEIMI